VKTARCRSCGEEILWLPNDQTGKKAPIELTPDADGPVVLMHAPGNDEEPIAYHVLTKAERALRMFDPAVPANSSAARYRNHFQTCAQAQSWKRGSR